MNRHDRRENEKLANQHCQALNELLKEFFDLLDRKPKPSDEEVRSSFKRHETEWKMYCVANDLNGEISLLFNKKVSQEWHLKYTAKLQTGKRIQKR